MVENFPSRLLHDVGLAAWFGGTLANAVALNRAAGQTTDANDAGRVANAGWDAWTPVNAVAIGAHLVGSVGQLLGNRGRLGDQPGVASMSVLKTVITGAALGRDGLQQDARTQGLPPVRRTGLFRHRTQRGDAARGGIRSVSAQAAAVGGTRPHRSFGRSERVRR